MRRVLVALAAVLILTMSLGFATGAQAKCSVTCLNNRVKQLANGLIKAEKTIASLSKTVSQQAQTIASQGQTISQQNQAIGGFGQTREKVDALYECLFEVPITEYGNPEEEEGYLYKTETETLPTTALDVPFEGEPVGAWFLIDGCNPATTASVKATSALAPVTDLRTLLQPRRRLLP
jgi:uncharacterized coiled-coil protein SlyX